ncbi:MAG TPA: hypothetical protein VMV56_02420, partial [Williamwhitmania sp.]|nr:hypothetical protein [Williamwhitmania sp.]
KHPEEFKPLTELSKDRLNELKKGTQNENQNNATSPLSNEQGKSAQTGPEGQTKVGTPLGQSENILPEQAPQNAEGINNKVSQVGSEGTGVEKLTDLPQEQPVKEKAITPERENPASDKSPEVNKIRLDKTKDTKSYADIKGIDPNKEITIYRAIPKGKGDITPGDFVSQDKEVAKIYAKQQLSRDSEVDIKSKKVKAGELKLHPDHQAIGVDNEFIYNPKGELSGKPGEVNQTKNSERASSETTSKAEGKPEQAPQNAEGINSNVAQVGSEGTGVEKLKPEITDIDLIRELDKAQNQVNAEVKKHGFGGISKSDQHPDLVSAQENKQKIFNDVYNTKNPDRPIGSKVIYNGKPATIESAHFDISQSLDALVNKKSNTGRLYTPSVKLVDEEGNKSTISVKDLNEMQKVGVEKLTDTNKDIQENNQEEIFKPESKRFISDETFKSDKEYIKNRIDQMKNQRGSGLNLTPEDIGKLARIGVYHIERGISTFADFSKKMIEGIPGLTKENLRDIWDHIKENYKGLIPEEKSKTEDKNQQEIFSDKPIEKAMGAAAVREFGNTTTLDDLTGEIPKVENTSGGSPSFNERLAQNNKKFTVDKFKTSIANNYAHVKAGAKTVWDVLSKPPKFDKYSKMYGEMDASLQEVASQSRNFAKEISKKFPALTREAMVNYIQSGGDEGLLKEWSKNSFGKTEKYKAGYDAALKLTDDEKVFAQNISSFLEARLKQGQDAGILKEGIENYLTGIWDKGSEPGNKLLADIDAGKLPQNFKFALKKIFQNYYEGEQAGFTPKVKDIRALISIYDQSFNKTLLSRAFVKSLHDGLASDGRPFIELTGARQELPSGEVPKEATLIKTNFKPKEIFRKENQSGKEFELTGEESKKVPVDISDYKVIDHPSLRKWKWAAIDKDGKPVYYQGDALVHPEIYDKLNNQLKSSSFQHFPFLEKILKGQALLKATKLSISAFHQVQEGVHAIFHRVNPFKTYDINFKDPKIYNLAVHGAKFTDFNAMQQWTEGLSGGGVLTYVPKFGDVLQKYNDYLFKDYIPGLKSKMMLEALDRNMKRYGGKLSEDEIYKLTANQGQAAFGELNYKAMGRNPTVTDMLRFVTLAPDFLEARLKFVGQAFTRYGTEQRVALGLMGATLFITARIANALFNNGETYPNYPFEVVSGGKRYGLRTILGDVEHLIEDPRSFVYNRISPLVRSGTELVTGRNSQGIKVSSIKALADMAQWFIPITAEQIPGLPTNQSGRTFGQSLLQGTGITSFPFTDTMQMNKKANDWLKKTDQQTTMQKQGIVVQSDYKNLLSSLDQGNKNDVENAIKDLKGKGYDLNKIRKHMIDYARRPFTGSRRKEIEFMKTLSPEELETYKKAKAEKMKLLKTFLNMIKDFK